MTCASSDRLSQLRSTGSQGIAGALTSCRTWPLVCSPARRATATSMTCLQNARAFLSAACITQGKRLNHGSLGYPGEAFACEVSPSAAYIKSVSRFKKHPGLMFTGHIQLLTTSYRSKRMVCHPCGLSSITWDECIPGNTSCQKQGKMLQPAKCCMKAQYRSFAAEHCHQYNDLQGLTWDIQLSRDSPAGSAGQPQKHKSAALFKYCRGSSRQSCKA